MTSEFTWMILFFWSTISFLLCSSLTFSSTSNSSIVRKWWKPSANKHKQHLKHLRGNIQSINLTTVSLTLILINKKNIDLTRLMLNHLVLFWISLLVKVTKSKYFFLFKSSWLKLQVKPHKLSPLVGMNIVPQKRKNKKEKVNLITPEFENRTISNFSICIKARKIEQLQLSKSFEFKETLEWWNMRNTNQASGSSTWADPTRSSERRNQGCPIGLLWVAHLLGLKHQP